MAIIKAGMQWPPKDLHTLKMEEHSRWYSGDPNLLADFYYNNEIKEFLSVSMFLSKNRNTFWSRQIKNDSDFCIHVPVASDIAETSASFLFGESPIVRINEQQKKQPDIASQTPNTDNGQNTLDDMLSKTGFFQKILEGAETASAIGGCYIKIAWDSEVCEYPIPLVIQADAAIPEFNHGFLTKCTFPYEYKDGSKVFRLMETYEKGKITNVLYQGSDSNLGNEVPLTSCEQTKELASEIITVDEMLVVYIPNMLPNRLNRSSRLGRSDYQGIETLMDSLDETFSAWMRDVQFARGRIHIPEEYLNKSDEGGLQFNVDKDMYVKLSLDPTNTDEKITITQFMIRANEFEKTSLNLLDRIITSAGYSPQSFGLNIQGRAESGVALNVRERKSFATTNKKQQYWETPLKHIIKCMCLVYNQELGGKIQTIVEPDISFADGITNNTEGMANSVKLLSDAQAISTDTKVRMIHPEWSEQQITDEVDKILNEGTSAQMFPPDGFGNQDISQINNNNQMSGEGSDEVTE